MPSRKLGLSRLRYDTRVRPRWQLLLVLAVLSATCGGGGRVYPVDLPDDAFDLEAMALREEDMPDAGLRLQFADTFSNEEWAEVFENFLGDPPADRKLTQLEAQGRVLGYVAYFSWEEPIRHLGQPRSIESTTTIYRDTAAASEAMRARACGLVIGDDEPLEPFDVPHLGDEAVGFYRYQEEEPFGTYVETIVCFRTGRLVHAVTQGGLEGTQDPELSIALARRMLERVNEAFDAIQDS